jgi:glycosyltransferase involved in cell wall biosynthesis
MANGSLALAAPQFESRATALDRQVRTVAVRTIHVINGEHYAGAERVQDLLAARLPEMGADVGFVCLKPGQFAAMRTSRGADVIDLPMRSRFDLRPAIRLARLVRRDRIDLLHTHSARALLIARLAAAICRVPIVHHVHGNTLTEVGGRRWTRINAWAERRSLPAVEAIIAVSPSVADYLRGVGVSAGRVYVVPNGVPSRPSLPVKQRCGSFWTIGFIALLRPRKGLETFLDAVAIVRSRGLDVRPRIVGRFETSDYERQTQERACGLSLGDAIEWRGFRQAIDVELDAMDLLAFPSVLPEGMPMVLLEAMGAGVPIVASRVAGVTDVLRDGVSGLLVPPGDPAALAEALARLVHDATSRERLRKAAYDEQRRRFSDVCMAAAVSDVYRKVLAKSEDG